MDPKHKFQEAFQAGELHQKWSRVYEGGDYLADWARHRFRKVLGVLDAHGLGRSGRALDLGVGSGALLKELAARGSGVFGADFSIPMIQGVRAGLSPDQAHIGRRLFVSDVEAMPVKENSLNLVTCVGVLEYVSTDRSALSELFRAIRSGGYLLLVVASYHRIGSLVGLIGRKMFGRSAQWRASSTNGGALEDSVRMVKPLDLKHEALQAGFTVEEFMCFGGKLLGRYFPLRFFVPGWLYVGDHCLLLLRKPGRP